MPPLRLLHTAVLLALLYSLALSLSSHKLLCVLLLLSLSLSVCALRVFAEQQEAGDYNPIDCVCDEELHQQRGAIQQ